MKFQGIVTVASLVVVVQGFGVSVVKNTLICYQCVVTSNDQCIDETYLKLCPSDQAYDRCMTTVQATPKTGVLITKKCALGLCTLADTKASIGLGMHNQCDRTKSSYYCTSCCQEDGCNKDAANYVGDLSTVRTYVAFLSASVIFNALIPSYL